MHCTKYILDLFFSSPGTCLNIHEDERMKPENWIPLGWLPIVDNERSLRPSQGYEGCAARNCRLFHECWKHFLSNWDMFSTKHRIVIYPDGIARETMHFIAGLLGDQQVYLVHLVYLCHNIYLEYFFYLVYLLTYRKEINSRVNLLLLAIAARQPRNSFLQLIVPWL